MSPRATALSGAALLALLLSGCATLGRGLEPPQILLQQVRVVSVGFLSQEFALKVRVQNPNDLALPVSGLRYTLEIDGREIGSGMSPEPFTVPALGETDVNLALTTEAVRLVGLLSEWGRTRPGTLPYALRGEVRLKRLPRTLRFEREGSVPLRL